MLCDQLPNWISRYDAPVVATTTTTSPVVYYNNVEMSTSIGIEAIDGLPAAFVDFNADRHVDIILINNAGRQLVALKGHKCHGEYHHHHVFGIFLTWIVFPFPDGKSLLNFFGSRRCFETWPNFACLFSEKIVNVVASDFNGNSWSDLLVTTMHSNEWYSTGTEAEYSLHWVQSPGHGWSVFNCNNTRLVLDNARTEPLVLGKMSRSEVNTIRIIPLSI